MFPAELLLVNRDTLPVPDTLSIPETGFTMLLVLVVTMYKVTPVLPEISPTAGRAMVYGVLIKFLIA